MLYLKIRKSFKSSSTFTLVSHYIKSVISAMKYKDVKEIFSSKFLLMPNLACSSFTIFTISTVY